MRSKAAADSFLAADRAIDKDSLHLAGIPSFEGLSWISDGDGGWTDLADNGTDSGIFFLKGLLAIPEPNAWILVVFGLLAIQLARRKRGTFLRP